MFSKITCVSRHGINNKEINSRSYKNSVLNKTWLLKNKVIIVGNNDYFW